MKQHRKIIKYLLRFSLTVLIMGALLQTVKVRGVLNAFMGVDIFWLLLIYILVLARRLLEATQMSFILHYHGYLVGWFRVFRANALAFFYGMFTPGAIAMVAKWADLTSVTGSGATVFNAIVYNRFLLDIQPILFGAIVLLLKNPTGEPLLVAAACLMAILALTTAFCLYSPRIGLPILKKIQTVVLRVSGKIGSLLDSIVQNLAIVQAFPISRHFKMSLIGFAAFTIGICTHLAIMKSLGFQVPVTTIVWVDAVLILASHIPVTISNFGIREGLVVTAFGLYGIAGEQAFAYGLLLYSCKLFIAIVGGFHQLMLVFGLGKTKVGVINQSL